MRWVSGALLSLFLSACSYAVSDIPPPPDHPTYAGSVHAFMGDHCLVCHSSPPDRGAPNYFRLDVYGDQPNLQGAGSMAYSILADVLHDTPQLLPGGVSAGLHSMPPGGGVGRNGKQLLINWYNDGAPP